MQAFAGAGTTGALTHPNIFEASFKLGADFIRDQILNFFPGNFSGAYTFTCLENFGRSLAGQPLVINPGLGCPANSTIPTVPADPYAHRGYHRRH